MIRTFYIVFAAAIISLAGCNAPTTSEPQAKQKLELASDEDKLSYGVGLNIGSGLLQQGLPGINIEAIFQGIEDSIGGAEPLVDQTELEQVLVRLRDREEAKMNALMAENAEKGSAYLAENGKREGVTTTESGLQYEILTAGEGDKPSAESVVKTHYHGTLIDGTVFDSSVQRGEPAQFAVNQVIKGWTEALQLMPVGSKWKLHIPAELAYGEMSPGPAIPPNSTLIFEVELLALVTNEEDAAQ